MAPTKVVSEYAKSGRSTCNGCGKSIGSGSLRIGSSGKIPKGFDMTKWYHLYCFPVKSNTIGSVEDIVGVASLKVCFSFFFIIILVICGEVKLYGIYGLLV
jgi:bifunctional polynucleotide phosphatase/kinase